VRYCRKTIAYREADLTKAGLAKFVTVEKGLGPEGRVAVVRFDRGDGINALSPEALRQLTDAARSFEDDGDTSVVVLTGGADAFSAGFDLKDAEGRSRKTMDIGSLRRHLKLGPRLSRAWQEMEQITIGAIEGFCIGGGVALAVALDFRVMGRDAHMRVPEIGLGMNMSWQSIPRMLHLIGPARTKQAVRSWPTSASAPTRPTNGAWWRRWLIPARRSTPR
jgi:enoyl-CoA hydratase